MDSGLVVLELGLVVVALAFLARVAGRAGIPAIPLYLLAGLAVGEGGVAPLITTQEFIEVGAQVGLVLLLLLIGLEYSSTELIATARRHRYWAGINLVLNFLPGFVAGFLLGWGLVPALFLAGITTVTSSGIMAKVLSDMKWFRDPAAPLVVSISITEDLAMALYLPLLAAALLGGDPLLGVLTAIGAPLLVLGVLLLARRFEVGLSRMIFSQRDEVLLLSILGVTLVVAGLSDLIGVSTAVGALIVGIVLSGPAADGARALLSPLRDLFAAVFFAFFGLIVDPAELLPVLPAAAALAGVCAVTKFATGWLAARQAGHPALTRARAGTALIPRGEFSIAIAGLAVSGGIEPRLGPLAAAFVLVLAFAAPLLARLSRPLARILTREDTT